VLTRLLALLLLAYLLWRGLDRLARWTGWGASARGTAGSPRGRPAPSAPASRQDGHGGQLVRCSRCGVHFPLARALPDGEGLFCSAECREASSSRG